MNASAEPRSLLSNTSTEVLVLLRVRARRLRTRVLVTAPTVRTASVASPQLAGPLTILGVMIQSVKPRRQPIPMASAARPRTMREAEGKSSEDVTNEAYGLIAKLSPD
jgi:hypothetical protein